MEVLREHERIVDAIAGRDQHLAEAADRPTSSGPSSG